MESRQTPFGIQKGTQGQQPETGAGDNVQRKAQGEGRKETLGEAQSADLHAIARDMRELLLLVREVVKYMKEAESEVPEKMRRFIMYMHDVHDVMHMYEERGLAIPAYILREAERCDDRYRHLLEDGHGDQGWLERVRAEMSQRSGNRWDHSRILPKQELRNETGNG